MIKIKCRVRCKKSIKLATLMIIPLMIYCVFSWAGCKERPLRKDIELHTTDTKHMMLLAVACGELKKKNEKVKQEMASVHFKMLHFKIQYNEFIYLS